MEYIKRFSSHSDYESYINSNDKILPNLSSCDDIDDLHLNPFEETRFIGTVNITTYSENISLYVYLEYTGSEYLKKIEIDSDIVLSTASDINLGYYILNTGEHKIKYTFKNLLELPRNTGLGFFAHTYFNSITIPKNIISIDEFTFIGLHLANITVDENNPVYDSRNNCNAIIETATNKLILGSSNTIIPNDITAIGEGAFGDCSYNENTLIIPDSVITIENNAFSAANIPLIEIGSGITLIGDGAFSDMLGITTFMINATTPPTIGSDIFNSISTNFSIYVPTGSVDAYKAAAGWSEYASKISANN